jgi:Lrp/AsnC family leucine-responsive transcriptional regulator
MDLEEVDAQILDILSKDGRIKAAEIAKRLDVSTSTVTRKIKRMEEEGIIRGYVGIIEDEKLGKTSRAVLMVKMTGHDGTENLMEEIRDNDDICNIYETMGNYDAILTVCSYNDSTIYDMIKHLRALEGVLYVDFASIVNRKKVMKTVLS